NHSVSRLSISPGSHWARTSNGRQHTSQSVANRCSGMLVSIVISNRCPQNGQMILADSSIFYSSGRPRVLLGGGDAALRGRLGYRPLGRRLCLTRTFFIFGRAAPSGTMGAMELFHRILKTAVEGGASDVHLKIGTPVIFRINRELVAIDSPFPTKDWMNKIVDAITPEHLMKRLKDEREIDFSYFAPDVGRFRTNLFQQRSQWCLAMRFVKTRVPTFEELGLLEQIKKVAESPRGIVLLAGSTGCGKSTTLAAMIEHINNNFKKHIISLEDPVEYAFEDNQSVIEQREIGLDTVSFHHALRNILRQDPDVIMIGEMRDDISFAASMSAADTGHLVLSTLHTTTAAQSITRILDFFKAEEREQIRRQLANTLRGVICQ